MASGNFPNPHQWKAIVPGTTNDKIYDLRVPNDMVGFITHIGNNSFDDTSILIKIDGESLEEAPIQREIGPINNPTSFDPPFVVKEKIEVFGTNNDTDSHTFEVVILGYFMDRTYFGLSEED